MAESRPYSKALILNDTSHESHVGCCLVMAFLKSIAVQVASEITTLNVAEARKKTLASVFDECDLIILNGEGSFHHDGKAGFIWLDFVQMLKQRNSERRFVLLNAAWYDNDVLNNYLPLFDYLSFRENASLASALPFIGDSSADVCPDFAFVRCLQVVREVGRPKRSKASGIKVHQRGVSGSHPLIEGVEGYLSIFIGSQRLRTLFYQISKRDLFSPRIIFRKYFEHFVDMRLCDTESYIKQNLELALLSTGRFHGIMIAIACNTDCVWVPSNTPKTENAVDYICQLSGVRLMYPNTWLSLSASGYEKLYENSMREVDRLLESAF